MDICNSYLKTLAGCSFKTVEQNVCDVRHFLRFLYSSGNILDNYVEKIHMPPISRSAKIPSAWQSDELKAMLAVIDRNNPIGKRIMPCSFLHVCSGCGTAISKAFVSVVLTGRQKNFHHPA